MRLPQLRQGSNESPQRLRSTERTLTPSGFNEKENLRRLSKSGMPSPLSWEKKTARFRYWHGSLSVIYAVKERELILEAAKDAYTMAIELNPALAEPYVNRGITKNSLRQYDEAIADYNRAIELNPALGRSLTTIAASRRRPSIATTRPSRITAAPSS